MVAMHTVTTDGAALARLLLRKGMEREASCQLVLSGRSIEEKIEGMRHRGVEEGSGSIKIGRAILQDGRGERARDGVVRGCHWTGCRYQRARC
jgi:hypothetical protein